MIATICYVLLLAWSVDRIALRDGVNRVNVFGYCVGLAGTLLTSVS
jgi:hypothetical protein